ncbi:Uncharacterised protein [uncultured archaeon]|nr:Uncharacterised protein [uncultured archaeon]
MMDEEGRRMMFVLSEQCDSELEKLMREKERVGEIVDEDVNIFFSKYRGIVEEKIIEEIKQEYRSKLIGKKREAFNQAIRKLELVKGECDSYSS